MYIPICTALPDVLLLIKVTVLLNNLFSEGYKTSGIITNVYNDIKLLILHS